jgi:hypothetical protein
MADRAIVYDGALPQTTDVLNTNLFGMISEAFQNKAIIGSTTAVAGLACAPTAPASLQVSIGTGSIYANDNIDASAYGDLGTNFNTVVKQGILQAAQILTITPPSTAGFSQVYLVEAILNDVDAGSMVLTYYNPAIVSNPLAVPFSGPAGSGASQFTIRTCQCIIALKAGVPATTGTQVAPAVDAGYVGLYAITVANGQTQITSGNIALLAAAPFFPTLPQVPYQVQQGLYTYVGNDTGTANNYVISFQPGQPIPLAYTTGMGVEFKAANACTGASVVNVQGLGNISIIRANGVALAANDITSGQIVKLKYDGAHFQMENYLGTGTNTSTITSATIPYIADTGAQNAIVATFSPAITSGQQIPGLVVQVKLANTITGACTINVNGLGAKNVTLGDASRPPYNVFIAGMDLLLEYDGTQYEIVNTAASMFYLRPTANYTIYVNTATGSDTLYDGTSASVVGGSSSAGPVKTIQHAVNLAFGYAPSQFTITIQVAAGTYNESVATPSYAGPNLVINGASTASVVVNSGNANCFTVSGPNTVLIQNLTIQNSGIYPYNGFSVSAGASLTTNNTQSNACSVPFAAGPGGTLSPGNHVFNGSGYALFFAEGGSIGLGPLAYTINTAISVSGTGAAVAWAGLNGIIAVNNITPPTFFNPSFVNGPKYQANLNGTINANTLGVNFFPGSVAGSTQTGGQYQP